MFKVKKLIASIILVCVFFATITVAIVLPRNKYDLKIGVLGEIAIPNKVGVVHLEESLKIFRNQHCNTIIITGNLTNVDQAKYYPVFKEIVKKIYGNNTPKIIYPQGKNDANLELYNEYFGGEFEIVNLEYLNILKLPYREIITDEYVLEVKEKLDFMKQTKLPSYIVSYTPPENTFYGSEVGSQKLKDLVNEYNNITWFSAGKYSQISSRATYNYLSNFYIGTEPLNKLSAPYTTLVSNSKDGRGMIYCFNGNEVKIEKWNFSTKKKESEYSPSKFKNITSSAPAFKQREFKFYEQNKKSYFTFSAAQSEDFVYAYQIVLIYSNSIVGSYTRSVYSSDYFLGKDNMAENYTIEISSGTSGLVSVGIIAIDDYNKESSMWVCDYSLRNTNTKF